MTNWSWIRLAYSCIVEIVNTWGICYWVPEPFLLFSYRILSSVPITYNNNEHVTSNQFI